MAYAVAAAALSLIYAKGLKPIQVFVLLGVYGALLEVGQLFIPGRNAALIDVAADLVGASIGIAVAKLIAQTLPELHSRFVISQAGTEV